MSPQLAPATKSILLVEHEPILLEFVRTVLERAGYVVLSAATAEKAMRIAQDYRGALDLLLTGYSMPGLTGAELAEKLLQSRPGLPVMLMSSESEGHDSASDHKWYFTAKPFSASVLLSHIGDALRASMWCLGV